MQPLEFSFGERLDLVGALRDAVRGHEAALKGIARRGGTNAATREAKAKHEAEIIDLGVLKERVLDSLRAPGNDNELEPESPFTVVGIWEVED